MHVAKYVKMGRDARILHPDLVNLYRCDVSDEIRIGSYAESQRGAKLGARCRISSHTFICEGVTIGDEVFIGHGVMFTNDRFPRATADDGRLQGPAIGRWKPPELDIERRSGPMQRSCAESASERERRSELV